MPVVASIPERFIVAGLVDGWTPDEGELLVRGVTPPGKCVNVPRAPGIVA